MAVRSADRVEGDFQNDIRLHQVPAPFLAERVASEMLGEILDLVVGQAGVSLADDAELAVRLVPHGEGVIG